MRFDTVLICGDRNWDDQSVVDQVVFKLKKDYKINTLVEGEAPGADTCGRLASEKYGLTLKPFPADWKRYGKGAGPIRNAQQLREGKPDVVVAFHDDIGNSRGTLDMVKKAASSEREIIVVVVYHSKKDKPYEWVWFSPSVDGFTLTQE